jgi:ABC-type sugar transport system ATPase subunit
MTTTTTAPAIEAAGLTKAFGTGRKEVRALDGLDLAAPSGKVTAVLGPNGAGKGPSRSGASSGWPASSRPSSRP